MRQSRGFQIPALKSRFVGVFTATTEYISGLVRLAIKEKSILAVQMQIGKDLIGVAKKAIKKIVKAYTIIKNLSLKKWF